MRNQPRVALALYSCALLLGPAAAAAAQPPVTISFRAVADNGQPVMDLKVADLVIKVDGKVRAIKSLDVVRIGATSGATVPARPAFGSNSAIDTGRDVILVIDDESIAPGQGGDRQERRWGRS